MFGKLHKKFKNSKGGFTLIELIVVVAILAIIAIILIPTIGGKIKSAKDSAAQSDARAVYSAAQLYATQYEVDTGTTLPAGTYTGEALDKFLTSSAFASMYDSTTKTLHNGIVVQSISVDDHGTVTSVTITDKNVSGSLTYPQGKITTSSSASGGSSPKTQ